MPCHHHCTCTALQDVFERPYFYTQLVPDVVGAEMCGTLKVGLPIAVAALFEATVATDCWLEPGGACSICTGDWLAVGLALFRAPPCPDAEPHFSASCRILWPWRRALSRAWGWVSGGIGSWAGGRASVKPSPSLRSFTVAGTSPPATQLYPATQLTRTPLPPAPRPGPNTKAAIMRSGLNEMRRFAKALYPTVRDETFFESCGVADLIATCYGGRNRLVAREFVEAAAAGRPATFAELEVRGSGVVVQGMRVCVLYVGASARTSSPSRSCCCWPQGAERHDDSPPPREPCACTAPLAPLLQVSLLHGQKLQGVLTSDEVQIILQRRGWELEYPLFTTVNRIVRGQLPPASILEYRAAAALHVLASPAEQSADDLRLLALGPRVTAAAAAP